MTISVALAMFRLGDAVKAESTLLPVPAVALKLGFFDLVIISFGNSEPFISATTLFSSASGKKKPSNQQQYTSISKYKQSGNLIYTQDILDKIGSNANANANTNDKYDK
jgi:hypothetical protein